MKIYAVQPDIAWENKAVNYANVRRLLAAASPAPGSLIILPEMFAVGFSMNLAVTRQGPEREDEQFLAEMAREYRACVAGGVVGAGEAGKGRNEAAVFSPEGKLLTRYTKIHPFSFGGEAQGHDAGAEIVTFDWQGFVAAPFVCYDLRFPEIFRVAALRGANLLIVMALWPAKRQQHWLTLLQARAIENQAYVVGVNRVGADPHHSYVGRSVLVSPHGVIIADAGEGEQVLSAAVDLELVTEWRRDFPALPDARAWLGDQLG